MSIKSILDNDRILEILTDMGSVNDPWELFEPYLYKDKLGDSQWHCEIRTIHNRPIYKGEGKTIPEAVFNCYDDAARDITAKKSLGGDTPTSVKSKPKEN